VTFAPAVEHDGAFEVVSKADFSADYASWQSVVCANYLASADSRGYRLVTGGTTPLGPPLLADKPVRTLMLP